MKQLFIPQGDLEPAIEKLKLSPYEAAKRLKETLDDIDTTLKPYLMGPMIDIDEVIPKGMLDKFGIVFPDQGSGKRVFEELYPEAKQVTYKVVKSFPMPSEKTIQRDKENYGNTLENLQESYKKAKKFKEIIFF